MLQVNYIFFSSVCFKKCQAVNILFLNTTKTIYTNSKLLQQYWLCIEHFIAYKSL